MFRVIIQKYNNTGSLGDFSRVIFGAKQKQCNVNVNVNVNVMQCIALYCTVLCCIVLFLNALQHSQCISIRCDVFFPEANL